MLTITIPAIENEQYNEETNEFVYQTVKKEQMLHLEHSLISLSKWESKWCKPFFSKEEKTLDEEIDYIKCMTLDKNVDSTVYDRMNRSIITEIREYINAPMTATKFYAKNKATGGHKQITSEYIYYWMIAQNIPVEFEKWHINKLLTLIRVCNIENAPDKKMSSREIMSRNAALNAARRKQLNTKG